MAQTKRVVAQRGRLTILLAREGASTESRSAEILRSADSCENSRRAQGCSWGAICRETGLGKGTAQRAFSSLPKIPSRG